MSPRWKKMIRDFFGDRTRASLMLLAITVGIFAVTTILSTYAILSREMARNYMDTNPASATLDMGEVTAAALETARNFPGISEVEARSVIDARVKVNGAWTAMLLFVFDDFDAVRLNTFKLVEGKFPPLGAMLIERTAEGVLMQGTGGSVIIQTANGVATEVDITGLVWDATLAPATQEQKGYGYITRQTLGLLGEVPVLQEVRIQLNGNEGDITRIEETSRAPGRLLIEQGHHVHEIRVPPPLTHPHQTQMLGVLFLFLAFAVMAFILSAILVATIIAALLTSQVREIGVMKAVGARSSQIAIMYLSMLLGIGLISATMGVPPGLFLAGILSDTIADLLNLEIQSYGVPVWVYTALIGSSLVLPPLVALGVIVKGSTLSVRDAISDNGVGAQSVSSSASSGRSWIGLSWSMAFRNMFRRRGRLYLSLALLSIGGGMFISALNINSSWAVFVDRVYTDRSYDAEYLLVEATLETEIERALEGVPHIENVEFWGYEDASFAKAGQIDISRTYPDGGHGNFVLMGASPSTTMIDYPVMEGRWLEQGDADVVVLNQIARAMAGNVNVTDTVLLSIHGETRNWRVVGIVEEIGTGAVAYVTDSAFDGATGTTGRTKLVRIETNLTNPVAGEELIRSVDKILVEAGIKVERVKPLSLLGTIMGEHVALVVVTLIMTAVLLGLIGLLGLASTMSMNVLERTREIGVMKVGGATPANIQNIIISEGVFIALISWVLAIVVSLPFSAVIGSIIGEMSFKTPLGLHMSWFAVSLWFALVVILAIFASMIPAKKASQMSIYEAITYG